MNYEKSYYLRHPIIFLGDLKREIRWAWQRVYRGWDERAAWAVDSWLFEYLPQILRQLKENKHGLPVWCFDAVGAMCNEHGEYSNEAFSAAEKHFDEVIDKMIDGFEAGYRLDSDNLNTYSAFAEWEVDQYDCESEWEIGSQNSEHDRRKAEFGYYEKCQAERDELDAKLKIALDLYAQYHNSLWD